MMRGCLLALAAVLALPGSAAAAQKAAVFPFEIDHQPSEEDFFIGKPKTTPEEVKRLALSHEEFLRRLAADGRYEIVDLSPLKAEIEAAQPIYDCNDCDVDIAKKAGAEVAITTIVDKISETHLNLMVTIRDVATGAQLRHAQAVIQGNTDETWLHGTRWILKNRILAEGAAK
jgi:hypothetical protein